MVAFYRNNVNDFLKDGKASVLGALASGQASNSFETRPEQEVSWEEEIEMLEKTLSALNHNYGPLSWGLLLEYTIPRRPKRIDAVILAGSVIFILEFKNTISNKYKHADKLQVEDYCLDLEDFHKESTGRTIVPVLIVPDAAYENSPIPNGHGVNNVLLANRNNLGEILWVTFQKLNGGTQINLELWSNSIYSPTPTIIAAAQYMYATHNVSNITRNDAGHENLKKTSDVIISAIHDAKANNKKLICFITGVPGSGKTLAGLNIVHNFSLHGGSDLGIFLSGNGPLVEVLQTALVEDAHSRRKIPLRKARHEAETFIQGMHGWIKHYDTAEKCEPLEHVVIFDEAQRAWKAGRRGRFQGARSASEPELILNIMDRQKDWAVIVALVGLGQEINKGEGGLREWGTLLSTKFTDWKIYISPELKVGNRNSIGDTLFDSVPTGREVIENGDLHLDVSVRSYRAEKLSQWCEYVLNNENEKAKEVLEASLKSYPIKLTRDLDKARSWLKIQCRGLRLSGLLATSEARRLRPYGVFVDMHVDASKWFLGAKDDVRSSSFLELVGKEYLVQGLELDWTGLCWDADFRRDGNNWGFYSFRGTKWQKIKSEISKRYLLNKYRVLLTRAREGMIIWVPKGDEDDSTRNPLFYDAIADYLKQCGVEEIL